jgi:preprotein translocase subunit SecY
VFALGIMPYITASIIMQLLTVVIPKLEEWKKEGETGTKKITQWTRYLTVASRSCSPPGSSSHPHRGRAAVRLQRPHGLIPTTRPDALLMILTLTAGTAFIMWLGELITQRGIGNGMSLIIFAAIISELPAQGNAILQAEQGGPIVFSGSCSSACC